MNPSTGDDSTPFRIWPYVVVYLLASIWLAFSEFQREQTSDSIIFVLASLHEWRFFYWEQDRVGMLVPLLASWCPSPFHNLLIQTALMAFAGLMLPMLLARVITPCRPAGLAVLVANAVFIAFAPTLLHENWMLVCNYPCGLCLGLWAVTLVDRRPWGSSRWVCLIRLTFAAGLFFAAIWQYIGIVVFLGPLLLFRTVFKTGPGTNPKPDGWRRIVLRPIFDRRALVSIPLLCTAFGANYLILLDARERHPIIIPTKVKSLPIEDWSKTAGGLLSTAAELPGMNTYAAVLLGIALVGGVGYIWNGRTGLRLMWAFVPVVLAGAIEFGMLSTREWTMQNLYHPRYLVAILTSATVGIVSIGLVPLLTCIPRRHEWPGILLGAIILFAAINYRYGTPSSETVRHVLDEHFGKMTPYVLENSVDAIGSEYWVLWTSVFHANMALYERGESRVVLGVGQRSEPMYPRWSCYQDGFRVVVTNEDFDWVEFAAAGRGLSPLTPVSQGPRLSFPGARHAPPRDMTLVVYHTRVQHKITRQP